MTVVTFNLLCVFSGILIFMLPAGITVSVSTRHLLLRLWFFVTPHIIAACSFTVCRIFRPTSFLHAVVESFGVEGDNVGSVYFHD